MEKGAEKGVVKGVGIIIQVFKPIFAYFLILWTCCGHPPTPAPRSDSSQVSGPLSAHFPHLAGVGFHSHPRYIKHLTASLPTDVSSHHLFQVSLGVSDLLAMGQHVL